MRGKPEGWEFTERRRVIAMFVATGMTNREIGDALYITEATVKSHVRMLLAMFGLKNRMELIALAYREGWMPLPAPSGGWVITDSLMAKIVEVFAALRDEKPRRAAAVARGSLHLLPDPSRVRTGPPKDPRQREERPEDAPQSLA